MDFKFGVIADVQYSDEDDRNRCQYRKSLGKLRDAVSAFNQMELDFVVQLGDMINRDEKSFDEVLPILADLKHQSYAVIGNHDLCVEDSTKKRIFAKLGMPYRYYSKIISDWKLLFLDGNEISLNAYPEDSERHASSVAYFEKLDGLSEMWNGAMGDTQLQWLENELHISEKSVQKVIIFCHYPLTPESRFTLWNRMEVMQIVNRFDCVKVWVNGHHHEGGHYLENGKHYITFKGMVETDDNSFATVSLGDDKLEITGFGREESRVLSF